MESRAVNGQRVAYTVAESAAMLGCSEEALRARIRRGVVPAVRVGPRLLYVPRWWFEENFPGALEDAGRKPWRPEPAKQRSLSEVSERLSA